MSNRAYLLASVYLLAVAGSADAFFMEPLVKQTLGSQNYVGTYASVDLGGDLHFKPAFNSYHSNTSSGTYKTYSLDVTYDWKDYSFNLTGGFTPTVNSYDSRFIGGHVSRNIEFKDGDDKFFKSLNPSAGVTQTIHAEQVTTPAITVGPKTIPATAGTIHIQETDVEGSVAVGIPDATLSLDLTKSAYNQDLARLSVRAAQVTRLAGLNQTIQGFPDFNANEKIQLDFWDPVKPYFAYTYTSFKVSLPVAATYTAGLRVLISPFTLDGSYQRYAQKGSSDINYFSLSASMRFE